MSVATLSDTSRLKPRIFLASALSETVGTKLGSFSRIWTTIGLWFPCDDSALLNTVELIRPVKRKHPIWEKSLSVLLVFLRRFRENHIRLFFHYSPTLPVHIPPPPPRHSRKCCKLDNKETGWNREFSGTGHTASKL